MLLLKIVQDIESGLGEWDKNEYGEVASGRVLLSSRQEEKVAWVKAKAIETDRSVNSKD